MLKFEVYFRQVLTSGLRIDKAVEIHEANDFKSVEEIILKRLDFFTNSFGGTFEYFINKVYESENSFQVDNPILLQNVGVFDNMEDIVEIKYSDSYEKLKDEKSLTQVEENTKSEELEEKETVEQEQPKKKTSKRKTNN